MAAITAPKLTTITVKYGEAGTVPRFFGMAELRETGVDLDALPSHLMTRQGEEWGFTLGEEVLLDVEETFTLLPAAPGYGLMDPEFEAGFRECLHVYGANGEHVGDLYGYGDPYGMGRMPSGWHAEYISEHDGDSYVAEPTNGTQRKALYRIVSARQASRRFGRDY